jgi:hypothetical protein
MRPPCEVIVTKLLPQLRAAIVKILTEKHNLKQREIAERLGITQSAVSLYLLSGRAEDKILLEMFPELEARAESIADAVFEGRSTGAGVITELCNTCVMLRKNAKFCEYHQKVAQIERCDVCRYVLR